MKRPKHLPQILIFLLLASCDAALVQEFSTDAKPQICTSVKTGQFAYDPHAESTHLSVWMGSGNAEMKFTDLLSGNPMEVVFSNADNAMKCEDYDPDSDSRNER